jgi:hypothetical protein
MATDVVDKYANKVDETIRLLRGSFPDLLKSDFTANSLTTLLDKKRVAKQLGNALSQYASSTTPRDARLITREFSTLTAAFYDLANESMETAKLMRQYADTMKR